MVYIALLRADGTEPDAWTGYERICAGEAASEALPSFLQGKQIVFPDVRAPGYGMIHAMAACDKKTGGSILYRWPMETAMDVHQGVVPVIHNGKLWRGVEAKAKITVCPSAACRAGGF